VKRDDGNEPLQSDVRRHLQRPPSSSPLVELNPTVGLRRIEGKWTITHEPCGRLCSEVTSRAADAGSPRTGIGSLASSSSLTLGTTTLNARTLGRRGDALRRDIPVRTAVVRRFPCGGVSAWARRGRRSARIADDEWECRGGRSDSGVSLAVWARFRRPARIRSPNSDRRNPTASRCLARGRPGAPIVRMGSMGTVGQAIAEAERCPTRVAVGRVDRCAPSRVRR
jgi:hypothetical protein